MASELILPGRYEHMNAVSQLNGSWDQIKLSIRDDYQNDPVLDKAKAANEAGLNDAAINYIWNLAMYDLRRKIVTYGIEYFASAINWGGSQLRTIEDLNEVKDYEVINGAYTLGILLPEAHFHLQHCREIRNKFSTAHYPMGEIDGIELLNFVKNCVKYVLTFDLPVPGLQIKDLISKLSAEKVEANDKTTLLIEGQAGKIREAIMHSFFSSFIKQDCDATLKSNIKVIAPEIWKTLDDEFRSNVAVRYVSLKDVKSDDEIHEAEEFLKLVGGIKYIPEDNRAIIFNRVAQQFLDAHNGWNNFYNEPTYAKALHALDKEVPMEALRTYVLSVVSSFVGNGYGVSNAAQPFNIKMLESLSQAGVDMVFKLFANDLDLMGTMTYTNPAKRMNLLMEILKEKTISAEHEVIFKFYIGSDSRAIKKHFAEKYRERTDLKPENS